jgi:hypothetical protein
LLGAFPDIPAQLPDFYGATGLANLIMPDVPFIPLMERLLDCNRDADTYFACLANLHKRRLKYERILQTQALPTFEQVGPRGLLQYGTMSPLALTGLLLWRKWLFDIDNRAGQETGYIFEPIIAHAIGGAPFTGKSSPIKRHRDKTKTRQVDCVRDGKAYEFKIRVTIAASGQGRWQEELDYPIDCRRSGYKPVLIVLDPTPNPKLEQLEAAFLREDGDVFKGDGAWRHLDSVAGPTMARFLEKYVRAPMEAMLAEVPVQLPEFIARMEGSRITLLVGGQAMVIDRASTEVEDEGNDDLPEDTGEQIPGP